MAAEIRSDGTSSRSTAGEIHSALPKLRDQLQPRGRHGAPLHRETKRRRSREKVERVRQPAVLATIAKWVNGLITNPGIEERDFRDRRQNCEGSSEGERESSEFQSRNWNLNQENRKT